MPERIVNSRITTLHYLIAALRERIAAEPMRAAEVLPETLEDLHTALEEQIAQWKGTERALVFSSGYHANLGVIQALASHPRIAETARAAGFGRVDLVAPDADAVTAFVRAAPA